jgi:hypothetical protein
MIHEVRNYHFRPDLFEDYKAWAKDLALPYLGKRMDILGFWVNSADAPQVSGAPLDDLGSANVTWVIRWRDVAHRDKGWAEAVAGPEWEAIIARVPGGMASYLRSEAKFADALI